MKVKEIEDFVDIVAYESKDDNFFIEKKRQGFDMQNGARYETDVMSYQDAEIELRSIINNNLK